MSTEPRNYIMSNTKSTKFQLPRKFRNDRKNIWSEIMESIEKYKPLDLALGFPDYSPSKSITALLASIANQKDFLVHQYTRDFGHLRLVNSFAKLYSHLLKRKLDAQEEILTMSSGIQALYTAIMAIVDIGDEVIILEPYFDFYEILVNIAGGKCKFIPLIKSKNDTGENFYSSSEWKFNEKEMAEVFNEKTKLFIFNNPNNPLGKVYDVEEMNFIAELCRKWNVVCLADEVYEFCVYSPNEHIRMATLPEMWERTITICCPGKLFEITGWELGISYGPKNLLNNLKIVHQNLVYTSNTPIQEAYGILFEKEIDKIMEKGDNYSPQMFSQKLLDKREFIAETLMEIGIKPVIPQGGFLIMGYWKPISHEINLNTENNDELNDIKLTKWMIKSLGVACVPVSPFYCEKNRHLGEDYIRFCFLKNEVTLDKLKNILTTWAESCKKPRKMIELQ